MLEKLIKYKKEHGHCYVPADYNQTNYGVQDPLVTWVLKTRRDYVDNNLDQNKTRALDNINFLKWTSLKQYFDPENKSLSWRPVKSCNEKKFSYSDTK